MATMTWKQLKEFVDRELAELEASEDVLIWYIDISFPSVERADKQVSVSIDVADGLAISC